MKPTEFLFIFMVSLGIFVVSMMPDVVDDNAFSFHNIYNQRLFV